MLEALIHIDRERTSRMTMSLMIRNQWVVRRRFRYCRSCVIAAMFVYEGRTVRVGRMVVDSLKVRDCDFQSNVGPDRTGPRS